MFDGDWSAGVWERSELLVVRDIFHPMRGSVGTATFPARVEE